jgi:hypothetical protein
MRIGTGCGRVSDRGLLLDLVGGVQRINGHGCSPSCSGAGCERASWGSGFFSELWSTPGASGASFCVWSGSSGSSSCGPGIGAGRVRRPAGLAVLAHGAAMAESRSPGCHRPKTAGSCSRAGASLSRSAPSSRSLVEGTSFGSGISPGSAPGGALSGGPAGSSSGTAGRSGTPGSDIAPLPIADASTVARTP